MTAVRSLPGELSTFRILPPKLWESLDGVWRTSNLTSLNSLPSRAHYSDIGAVDLRNAANRLQLQRWLLCECALGLRAFMPRSCAAGTGLTTSILIGHSRL